LIPGEVTEEAPSKECVTEESEESENLKLSSERGGGEEFLAEKACVHHLGLANYEFEPTIEKAIAETLPKRAGERDRKIFELARSLKAVEGLKNIDPNLLRPVVERWHNRALPVITTKEVDATWFDFLYGWAHVKSPKGQVMNMAIERATTNPVNAPYGLPAMKALLSLCRALQEQNGKEPFFLSTCKVSELYGIDRMTAFRWLWMLEKDGWIMTVEKGNHTKATRYRFIGKEG